MTAQIIQLKKFKKIDEDYYNLIDKLNYYKEALYNYETAITVDGDNILAGMSNIFGKHNKDTKTKFLSFLKQMQFAFSVIHSRVKNCDFIP